MDLMCQVYIDVFAQIFVMLSSLYRFSFIIELAIIAGDELGFPDVKLQLVSVKQCL